MKKHAHAKVVALFGGTSALAKGLGLSRQVVHNWGVRGVSPVGRYMMRDLAAKRKIKLPEGFAP